MNKPKVSIILPIYNTEKYIRNCLDSIIHQTFKDIEIICVNDGSTDGTLTILREYAEKDSRIKIITQENQGPSAARNNGIKHSQGKYIQFIDSDDELELDAIQRLYTEAEKNSLDMVMFNIKPKLLDERHKKQYKDFIRYYKRNKTYSKIISGQEMFYDMRKNYDYLPSPVLYLTNSKLIKNNNIYFYEGIIHEDNLFTLELIFSAKRVLHIDKELYIRNVREGSIMTKDVSTKNIKGYFFSIKETLKFLHQKNLKKKIAKSLSDYVIRSLQHNLIKDLLVLSKSQIEDFQQTLNTKDLILFNLISETALSTTNQNIFLKHKLENYEKIYNSKSFKIFQILFFIPKKVYSVLIRRNMFKTVFKHIKSSIKYLISIPKKIIVFIALHTNKKFLSFKNKSFLKEDLYINNLELHKEKPLLYFKEYKSEFTSKKITNKEILLKLHNSTINKTPKLTVIMPVYNAERYLDESIEDILNQTLTEFELICIDDSSTDNSLKILKEYAEKDNRITILQQPKMNAGSARNIGIYIAKGEYLMFLDADDRFKSNLLKEMYTQAKNKNLDMCICNANKLNNQTTKIVKVDYFVELNRYPQKAVFNKEDLKENLFLFCTSITWNKIFNKDFIRENKISFQEIERSNDLYFAYYSLLKSKRIAVLNKNLINYRTGIQTNLQSGNDKTPFSFLKALLLLKYNIEKESLFQGDIKQSFINMSINIIHYNIKRLKTNKNKQLIKSWLKNKGFNELELLNHSNNYYLYDNRQKLKEILNI